MTRASEWRSPSSDLMTRESFALQRLLVTTRPPRLLMFSVNVSSVGNVESALVSITATAVILRFSDRPVAAWRWDMPPTFCLAYLSLKRESGRSTQETPRAVLNLGRNSARSSGVNHTIHPQAAASAKVNKPIVTQRTNIGPGIIWWIIQPAANTVAATTAKPDQNRRAKLPYGSPMMRHVALITK